MQKKFGEDGITSEKINCSSHIVENFFHLLSHPKFFKPAKDIPLHEKGDKRISSMKREGFRETFAQMHGPNLQRRQHFNIYSIWFQIEKIMH